jgi:glycosyltransferase involved in cell wall biosynthesis
MNPNLLIAAGIFHPEAGGPATYLHEILPALQSKGWIPSVLSYGNAPTDDYPYLVKRIPRRILPIRMFHYWQQSKKLAAEADLIYAHTIDLPIVSGNTPRIIKIVGDQAWERCIRRGWILPTTDIDDFQKTDYSWLVSRQQESRSQQVRDFDAVIVPSDYLKQMVIGWGVPENRVHVIYNAMPSMSENLPNSQEAARELLGWDDTATILTAARLNPWKGVDHLISALTQVPELRLIVAGDGSEMLPLQQVAKSLGERVQLLGRVPREKLYLMMQAADYFALYSGYEGLPHTLLEALRVGTPVIASDKGGCPEVVQDGINGFLVPYVNIDALAETIHRAFETGRRAELSLNSQVGMERFAFKPMVKETDKVLRGYLS